MKKTIVIAVTLLSATLASADERKFSAADVPAARIKQNGRIVISNDSNHITAFRFFDNIREALVSVRTLRSLVTHATGSVFDSNARLDTQMPPYLSSLITEASRTHGVDPRLVAAICRRESAFNPNAVSRVGAGGIMQLMPATARYLGVSDVFDARQNVFAGTRYLRTLLDAFNGDMDLAVAAYNAGPGAVRKYNGIPPYAETRAYVVAVRANYERSLRSN
ncbi:MAG TPA: lytic transglycosylase domain-containing protein [Thermoanaerobaculia bacterium]|jgi:soluble lytic murein transglycosylase-like protein